MLRQTPTFRWFAFGIKNKETDLPNILMTLRELKYLSKRTDAIDAHICRSIVAAREVSISDTQNISRQQYTTRSQIN